MKKNIITALLLFIAIVTIAQNNNLRQYLYTKKVYVNNQLRNLDSMTTKYPNPSEKSKSDETWFLWNIAGQAYTNYNRYTYTHNSDGRITESIMHPWDGSNWTSREKVTYSYNSMGSVILNNVYYFQNGNWIEKNRSEWTYNSQGTMIEYQASDTVGGTLSVKFRNVYTIDALQRTKEIVSQNQVSNNWENQNRTVYYFTGNSTLFDSAYSYNWNISNSVWTPSSKSLYKYNAQGLETEYLQYNLVTNKPQQKTVREYTPFDKELYSEYYQWNNNTNQWYLSFKYTNAYDTKNRETESIFYLGSSSGLQFGGKTDFMYSADSSYVQYLGSTWVNNGWQPNEEYTYYFEQRQTASAVIDMQAGNLKAFPNPMSSHSVIEFEAHANDEATIQIYDCTGRQVYLQKHHTTAGRNVIVWNAVDDSGAVLPNGTYIIRVSSDTNNLTFHLIKQ